MAKIIGATVGTTINPQAAIHKTTHAAQIYQNANDIKDFGGTVEITSKAPEKKNTVLTINPYAEEINLYSAEEIDEMFASLETGSGGSSEAEWRLARTITLESDVSKIAVSIDDDGNPLRFKEGMITWVNPKSDVNCVCYLYLFGDKGDTGQIALGNISSNTSEQRAMWLFSRVADRTLIETMSTAGASKTGTRQAHQTLYKLGNITEFYLATDGAARYLMMTGATLKIYVRGEEE